MDKYELMNYIIVVAFTIVFMGAGIYLGWKLRENKIGDCVLFCTVLATLMLIELAVDKFRDR